MARQVLRRLHRPLFALENAERIIRIVLTTERPMGAGCFNPINFLRGRIFGTFRMGAHAAENLLLAEVMQ